MIEQLGLIKLKRYSMDNKYVEYIADNLEKNLEYSEYIAENLDKNLDYVEYIADNLYTGISKSEYDRIQKAKKRAEKIDKILKSKG